jgi:hypothetical protein
MSVIARKELAVLRIIPNLLPAITGGMTRDENSLIHQELRVEDLRIVGG